jgi:hypothetical protein
MPDGAGRSNSNEIAARSERGNDAERVASTQPRRTELWECRRARSKTLVQGEKIMTTKTTPLFTLPIEKTELRALKLAAAKTELSVSALVRRGIGAVLNELSPAEGETWEGMQIRRASRRSEAA